ncbi:MAG: hypothetical protein HYV16_07725 [Gammaproteobacteria bacterium]|nr:hypothetical protein [Gammaproteobacteria bacterium]
MRIEDVPQEGNDTLGGLRKAQYAVDENGQYRLVTSAGWEVEQTVTRQALDHLEHLAAEARDRALRGEASPLEYHMYRRRMDLALLAQTTGLFQWRIRRHFDARRFAGLGPALLERYAEALGLNPAELSRLD